MLALRLANSRGVTHLEWLHSHILFRSVIMLIQLTWVSRICSDQRRPRATCTWLRYAFSPRYGDIFLCTGRRTRTPGLNG